jgi:hypothetical protein
MPAGRRTTTPSLIGAVVDTTTYARDLGDLPGGHSFAANADRTVGADLGFASSEAVMQQGTFSDEAQRTRVPDDVATLRLAMSGLDETQGTADDYLLLLTYGGLTTSGCDVVLDFDNSETDFAVCQTSGLFLNGTHVRITAANAYFNTTAVTWFFNTVRVDDVFLDGFETSPVERWSSSVP